MERCKTVDTRPLVTIDAKQFDALERKAKLAEDLAELVLVVGTILADDKPDKPRVLFGHPNRSQWGAIFLKAREILRGEI